MSHVLQSELESLVPGWHPPDDVHVLFEALSPKNVDENALPYLSMPLAQSDRISRSFRSEMVPLFLFIKLVDSMHPVSPFRKRQCVTVVFPHLNHTNRCPFRS